MIRLLSAIFIFSIHLSAFSQPKFGNISFDEALAQSKKSGKLIFLQYESSKCEQCNDVANKALSDPELAVQLEIKTGN